MSCKLTVFLTALGADCLCLAGCGASGVCFLLTYLIPYILNNNALFFKLGFEVCKGLAAALAAEPMVLIVVAVVDILYMDICNYRINGYIAVLNGLDELEIVYPTQEFLELVKAYIAQVIKSRMEVMTGAGINNAVIGCGNSVVCIQVVVMALFTLVIRLNAVFGAGLFLSGNLYKIFASALAGSVILVAGSKLLSAAHAVGVAGITGIAAYRFFGVSYLGAAGVIVGIALSVVVAAGTAGVAGAAGVGLFGHAMSIFSSIILKAAELAFLPVVVYIAPPLLKVCICNILVKNIYIYIVLLKRSHGVGLCDFLGKSTVAPTLAALGAFPILDIAFVLVCALGAGCLDCIVMNKYAAVGVGVSAELIGLVAGLKKCAAISAIDIAAVAGRSDGSFNCVAGFSVNMVVGVNIAVGQTAGFTYCLVLAACSAACVSADIGAFSTSRTVLSMIDSVTCGEFYPCIVVTELSNGHIAFLAVLARAVGVCKIFVAAGAFVVRQLAVFFAGWCFIGMLYQLGMIACILFNLGIALLFILFGKLGILEICFALNAVPVFKIALRGAGRLGIFLVSHLVGRVIVGIFFARTLESDQSGCLSACLILEKLVAFLA